MPKREWRQKNFLKCRNKYVKNLFFYGIIPHFYVMNIAKNLLLLYNNAKEDFFRSFYGKEYEYKLDNDCKR